MKQSKEGETREHWDLVYREYPLEELPWEEGKPAADLVELVTQGKVTKGPALDICCGSGNNVVYLAGQGFDVAGIDISPTAIEYARSKCHEAGARCSLTAGNAVHLHYPDQSFTFVFDRGCFHHIPPADRATFINGVHRVLKPGGKYYLICFSDKDRAAPYPISQEELRRLFTPQFNIFSLRETTFAEKRGWRRYFYTVFMEKKG